MLKFDPNADFEENFIRALIEIDDKDVADIIKKNVENIISLSESTNNYNRQKIMQDIEALIQKKISRSGD